MAQENQHGVVFPETPDGRRSTTALGRGVVAGALRPVDPVGARAAEQETAWRSAYVGHFRRALEAGLGSRADALAVAGGGLAALHDRMRVAGDAGERLLRDWPPRGGPALRTTEVTGTGERETDLSLPYRGERLRGDAIRRRVDAWVTHGVAEPTLGWAYDPAVGTVTLRVAQDGAGGAYELALPVVVTDAAGVATRVTVSVPADPRATIQLPVRYSARPRSVVFDPDERLLARITRL